MHEHAEGLAKVCEKAAYFVSGSIMIGDWVNVLDRHSWIIGAVLGLITCATNCYFKWIHYKLVSDQKRGVA